MRPHCSQFQYMSLSSTCPVSVFSSNDLKRDGENRTPETLHPKTGRESVTELGRVFASQKAERSFPSAATTT